MTQELSPTSYQPSVLPSAPVSGDVTWVLRRNATTGRYDDFNYDTSLIGTLVNTTGEILAAADPTHSLALSTKHYVDTVAGGGSGGKVPKAGATLTGPLFLLSDPTTSLLAATKRYVDVSNPIISGYQMAFGGIDMVNLKGLTYDPRVAGGTLTMVAGVLYCVKAVVRPNVTITQLLYNVSVAAASLANTYVGIYSTSGVLLSATANLSTASPFTSGFHTLTIPAFTTPVTVSSAIIAILIGSATTLPSLNSGGAVNANNISAFSWGQDGTAGYPIFTYGSGLTALPASLTLNSSNCIIGTAPGTAALLLGLN